MSERWETMAMDARSLLTEARAEVERLRQVLASESLGFTQCRAENERLRAALKEIADRHDSEDDGQSFTRGGGMAWAMARIARGALEAPHGATSDASSRK